MPEMTVEIELPSNDRDTKRTREPRDNLPGDRFRPSNDTKEEPPPAPSLPPIGNSYILTTGLNISNSVFGPAVLGLDVGTVVALSPDTGELFLAVFSNATGPNDGFALDKGGSAGTFITFGRGDLNKGFRAR